MMVTKLPTRWLWPKGLHTDFLFWKRISEERIYICFVKTYIRISPYLRKCRNFLQN